MAPSTSPSATTLPPSVEEAYRRKCVRLKKRTSDIEEANDAVRVRLARLKRQVEKQRLERAFLLEQLAKRTSTNVEDSDGSPSPPATPKDKPLRIKRGPRKFLNGEGSGAPGSTFISQNRDPLSPSSDVFNGQSQPPQFSTSSRRGSRKSKATKGDDDDDDDRTPASAKHSAVKAFDLYCREMRPTLLEKKKADKRKGLVGDDGDDVDMEDAFAEDDEDDETAALSISAALSRGWSEMEQDEKDEYEARAALEQTKYKKAKDVTRQRKQKAKEVKNLGYKEDTEAGDDEADEGDAKTVSKANANIKPEAAKSKVRPDTEMADSDPVHAVTKSKDDQAA